MKLGKYDIKILAEIKKANGKLFNLSGFCRGEKASKGAISYAINKLEKRLLINKKDRFSYVILPEGEYILNGKIRTGTRLGPQGVVRKKYKSIHAANITVEYKFRNIRNLIERLNPDKENEPVKMNNWVKYSLEYIDGTKIKINTKKIELILNESVGKDFEECEFRLLDKIDYWINKLIKVGVEVGNIVVNYSHSASVNSEFAKFIKNKLGHFEKTLSNGRKVWIDFSTGEVEQETDDEKLRDSLEDLMDDLLTSRHRFKDIDSISDRLDKVEKIIVGIGEIEATRLKGKLLEVKKLELRKDIKGSIY